MTIDNAYRPATEPDDSLTGPGRLQLPQVLRRRMAAAHADKVLIDVRELAANALESMGDGIVCTDVGGCVTYLNGAAELLIGWSRQAAAGRRLGDVLRLLNRQVGPTRDSESDVDVTMAVSVIGRLVRPNGAETVVDVTSAPMFRKNGQPAGTVIVLRDAGEMSRRISYLEHHDVLTGLPNRVLLQDRLAAAIALAIRHGKSLAVGFLDVDGFKSVNDTFGHAAGDEVLRSLAARLTGALRQSDSVGRYGGDEFVIVLSEIEHADACRQVGAKLLQSVAKPFQIGARELAVSASLGMAIFPDHGQTPDALIGNADAAMYDAKRAGTRRCHLFDAGLIADTALPYHASQAPVAT